MRMLTCNWLDLQALGSQPIMPKNLLDRCFRIYTLISFEDMSFWRPFLYLDLTTHYSNIKCPTKISNQIKHAYFNESSFPPKARHFVTKDMIYHMIFIKCISYD